MRVLKAYDLHTYWGQTCAQVTLEVPDLLLDNRMALGLAAMPHLAELRVAWLHLR